MLKVKKLGLALSSLAFLLVNACSSVFTPQVETVGTNNITNETEQSDSGEKNSFKTEAVAINGEKCYRPDGVSNNVTLEDGTIVKICKP